MAHFENTVCRVVTAEPYFDELHDYFESEIDIYARSQIESIDDL